MNLPASTRLTVPDRYSYFSDSPAFHPGTASHKARGESDAEE
jgi:hypothetical protein